MQASQGKRLQARSFGSTGEPTLPTPSSCQRRLGHSLQLPGLAPSCRRNEVSQLARLDAGPLKVLVHVPAREAERSAPPWPAAQARAIRVDAAEFAPSR